MTVTCPRSTVSRPAPIPATSPYVTAVGGTSLGVEKPDGTKIEYGWGNYRDFLANATVNSSSSVTTSGLTKESVDGVTYDDFVFYSGSGGGVSLIEPQPSYQAGVVPAALSGNVYYAAGYSVPLSPHRVDPDISAFADPYTGYLYGETYTISNTVADTGCVKKTKTTEYCEFDEGGTSLASPFTAGMMAIVDQQRGLTGRPALGFANPFLYSLTTGANPSAGAGINQVLPPTTATSVLRGYASNLNEVRVVTISSVPKLAITTPFPLVVCDATICEGLDDVFNQVTAGYNNTTGLGVPYIPSLIND